MWPARQDREGVPRHHHCHHPLLRVRRPLFRVHARHLGEHDPPAGSLRCRSFPQWCHSGHACHSNNRLTRRLGLLAAVRLPMASIWHRRRCWSTARWGRRRGKPDGRQCRRFCRLPPARTGFCWALPSCELPLSGWHRWRDLASSGPSGRPARWPWPRSGFSTGAFVGRTRQFPHCT